MDENDKTSKDSSVTMAILQHDIRSLSAVVLEIKTEIHTLRKELTKQPAENGRAIQGILLEIERMKLKTDQIAGRLATLENEVVSHHEFQPIQKLVYGLVGLVLSAFALGLIGLVFIR